MFVRYFVCLFVRYFVCLFVCLFVDFVVMKDPGSQWCCSEKHSVVHCWLKDVILAKKNP